MIYIKQHITENGIILAMCDSDLIGKVLEEGNILIDLKDYSEFYIGTLSSEPEADSSINKDKLWSVNVIGRSSVSVALSKGIIEKEHVKTVKGVPYANAFKFKEH
jgi:hypothetical protein